MFSVQGLWQLTFKNLALKTSIEPELIFQKELRPIFTSPIEGKKPKTGTSITSVSKILVIFDAKTGRAALAGITSRKYSSSR